MKLRDRILDDAVKNHDVPFVVAAAGDSKGITYSGAAGDAAPGRKAVQDTVFRIFSMTKAVGSTAAMILIDRGKLDPESPVEDILPEFSEIKVLEGFDGDKPKLRAPRTKATIRQLATHTSGLEYEFWNNSILEYQQKTGTAGILSGTKAALFYPMVTDPGTRWGYGIGIDWLGQAVERIDGRRSINSAAKRFSRLSVCRTRLTKFPLKWASGSHPSPRAARMGGSRRWRSLRRQTPKSMGWVIPSIRRPRTT